MISRSAPKKEDDDQKNFGEWGCQRKMRDCKFESAGWSSTYINSQKKKVGKCLRFFMFLVDPRENWTNIRYVRALPGQHHESGSIASFSSFCILSGLCKDFKPSNRLVHFFIRQSGQRFWGRRRRISQEHGRLFKFWCWLSLFFLHWLWCPNRNQNGAKWKEETQRRSFINHIERRAGSFLSQSICTKSVTTNTKKVSTHKHAHTYTHSQYPFLFFSLPAEEDVKQKNNRVEKERYCPFHSHHSPKLACWSTLHSTQRMTKVPRSKRRSRSTHRTETRQKNTKGCWCLKGWLAKKERLGLSGLAVICYSTIWLEKERTENI